jgi:LmbE family N-acetylglucosaminyl deacetylase
VNLLKVLLIDAHPDDGEASAGGAIAKFVREGHMVSEVYFAPCMEDPKNKGHIQDHEAVCKALGIQEVISFQYVRDRLEEHKQDIRNQLFVIREKIKPDLVLCPTVHDFHQDHVVVAEACQTIFRDTSTILAYEVLRSSTPDFRPNYFIVLTEKDAKQKLDALDLYVAQKKARPYATSRTKYEAHIRMRGVQAKTDYAEAFELIWGRIE